MISLDSVVGELHIVSGQRQSAAPFSGAFVAPRRGSRGRQDDTLFILVDASGSTSPVPELIRHIQQTYWHTPGSVTAGLRAAIEAGNNWLIDHNRLAPAALRAGVTCAVLRSAEIFVAQAGPSCAYVAHQGRVERFPRGDVGSLPPLGAARAIEVRYSRADLHPGDVLLLCDAAFPARIPEEAIASAIVYVGVEAALKNLEQLAAGENLNALVVEATAAPPAEAPGAPAATARPVESHHAPPRAPEAETARSAPQSRARIGEWTGALGRSLSRSAGSVGAFARSLFQRTLPDRPAQTPVPVRRRGARGASLERHTLLMAIIAIGIPIVVALAVSAVYLQRSAAAQIDALLIEARQLLADAEREPSIDAKRERWLAALRKANEALTLAPEQAAAIEARAQAQAQLDRLDGTQRVSPVLLYDFKKIGRHRLATQGVSLFVLDPVEGRVDRLTLNGRGDGIEGDGPALALAKGFTVDGRVVGDLIDMAWVEARGGRQKSALIVLERGGLIEFDLAFGPTAARFAESSVPAGARLDTFDGNLYLLDTTRRQVWKYRVAPDGYTTLGEAYFETPPPGIENAIDLAIDGNVYILEAGGAIYKYRGGSEAPFSPSGLPSPISRPVAAAVDPFTPTDSGFYVADLHADGGRIVHFAPDGRFVRQIRAPGGEFDALEDVLVDERAGRMYVISGGRLYYAALPTAAAAP